MTTQEIIDIVIEEIDILSDFTEEEIRTLYKPKERDQRLGVFLADRMRLFLAPNLKRRMRFVRSTDLTNKLFTSVKTIDQLVAKIEFYQTKMK